MKERDPNTTRDEDPFIRISSVELSLIEILTLAISIAAGWIALQLAVGAMGARAAVALSVVVAVCAWKSLTHWNKFAR